MLLADYWVHDLSPFILRLYDDFGLRWYGFAYVVAILLGVWILKRWARAGRMPLRPEEVGDLALYAGVGMILGGRLGYCLLYALDLVVRDPFYVVRVWEGGMASHGGMVGLALGTLLFARKRRRAFLPLMDQLVAVGPLGIGFGRLANFVNGELWGRPTTVPWAVIFPKAPLVHGAQVPRHPSQIYAAFLEGFLLFLLLLPLHKRHRRPGLTLAAFCLLYGVGRFVDEFWREPDPGQPVFFGWMSKGQLYTIPVFLFGLLLLAWVRRRPPVPAAYASPRAEVVRAANRSG